MTINEARKKVNLVNKDGGDTLYMQQQNYSLEALNKRDSLPDPFAKGPQNTTTINNQQPANQANDEDEEEMAVGVRMIQAALKSIGGDE